MDKKYGTLIALDTSSYRQHVVTDEGEHFWLTPGWGAAKGAVIGSRIELEYQSNGYVGLWYGRVVV